ncbi:MAG: hypothetical protein KC493_10830 [Bacteriovoracaceae bacterium]|nr:hypothetical protein [Bacteriovoracaceae bacterium]
MSIFKGLLILLFMQCFALSAIAQDERFFRSLFSGDLVKEKKETFKSKTKFRTAGAMHKVDLNADSRLESIVVEKKDGQDFIHIHDYLNKRIFSGKMEAMGLNSWLYKISIRRFANNAKVMILYFFEGETEYLEYRSNVRLYFLTFENNDFKTLAINKGPVIWDEFESFKKHYHQRKYKIGLFDYNKDGIKEIAVHYHLTSWVYFYKSPGKWLEL